MKLHSASAIALLLACLSSAAEPSVWAEIRIVDAATGGGVPLVELETVNSLRFVTDNAGRVAFHEPGLMGREIFFTVRSHGYEIAKDGFGMAGVKVTPQAGKAAVVKIARRNIAERLCRLTGEGLYRDSILLGQRAPLPEPLNPGKVGGQDSVQAAVYRGKVYWLWGDTQRMDYPLGLFRTAGATTPIPDPKAAASDPAGGIAFNYFVDRTGFTRAMMPLPERPEGVIWIFGLFVAPDEKGVDKLVGHYSRRKGLDGEYEQGLAVYNDDKAIFEPYHQLPLPEAWRRPQGHPIVYSAGGNQWLLFGSPNPNVRVPLTLKDIVSPSKYEALTCAKKDDRQRPDVDAKGVPNWRWQKELPPTDSKTEARWLKEGLIKPEHAHFCPANVRDGSERVTLHSGSVRWNPHRKLWVLVAGQIGGKTSHLGEVWYAEAASATGPFTKAVKIATHDRQTFYNVCHHEFLDRADGRLIHFEGTYTNDFSGNPDRTPRYNYNQVLYRLDLDDPALQPAQAK